MLKIRCITFNEALAQATAQLGVTALALRRFTSIFPAKV
jgi:hypothetical protein